MFHKFFSQDERRKFGGSDFIELQYCELERGTVLKRIVSADAIVHWKGDSLYVSGDDIEAFFLNYHEIFCGGTYNNGRSGAMDVCGINYYSPEQSGEILQRVRERCPLDHEVLLHWLESVENYNGFYILGI